MKSPKIKCLVTHRFWEQDLEYLRSRVSPVISFIIPKDYTTQTLVQHELKGVEIILGNVPAQEVLEASIDLQLLQIPWTGIDQVNCDLLKNYSFPVCNSHSNAVSVAELSIGLLLACIKQIPSHHNALMEGDWRRPGSKNCMMPELLCMKTVGLIGYGAIGRSIADMLSGFKTTVIPLASRGRKEGKLTVLGPSQLDLLCSDCDVLIISAPLTSHTREMIGYKQFEVMKSTTYLINVSRGDLINEEALFYALKIRMIAGAGIDVWYQKPYRGQSLSRPSKYPFERLKNIVMSPHRGGMVRGELPHLVDVVENLNRYAVGKPVINRVDLARGY